MFTSRIGSTKGPLSFLFTIILLILSSLMLPACGTTLHTLEPKEGIAYYNITPTFKWEALPQATGYQIQVALDKNFRRIVLDQSGIPQESFRSPQELPYYQTKLYWRVRPQVKGKFKEWSEPLAFEIKPLPTTQPISPSGSISELQPTFRWEKVPEACAYHIQVAANQEFTHLVWEQPACRETSSDLSQVRLKYDTPYYWRVRVKAEDGGAGPWSKPQEFLIPFPPPRAQEPAGSLLSLAVPFTWTPSPLALSHEIQISRDPGFAQLEVDELVEGNRYQVPPQKLSYNTTYYWRVRGHNRDGSSAWSSPLSFVAPFSAPSPRGPEGVIYTRNPLFQWDKDARASSYRLQVASDPDFSRLLLDIRDIRATSYSLTTAELSYKGKYYWRICSRDQGGESAWCSPLSFVINMPLPTPSAPMGTIYDPHPTFAWKLPPGASGVRLQISSREDFAVLVLDRPNLPGESFSLEQDLSYQETYYWRLKALFSEGESDWSPVSRFAVHYQIPEPQSPQDREEVKTLTPTLSWKGVPGATEYWIQIARDPGFTRLSGEAKAVKGLTYTAPRLEAGFSYFWRAKALFPQQGQSEWSRSFSFSIPQQPLPIIANSLQITDDRGSQEIEPTFTPDGKKLLYVVEKAGYSEIWCKEVSLREGRYQFAKGSSRVTWSVRGGQDRHPSPFPDSLSVAYTSNRLRGIDNIWSKPLAGHILTELTSSNEGCHHPAVSPDGKKIAYVAKNIDGTDYIWIMNTDGTGHTQFYEGTSPAWTPDGQRVVFASRRGGKYEIWIMDKDGLNLSRLTISTAGEEYLQPAVSPDGKRIAFISNKNGNWDIWIVNRDGSGMQQVTNHLGEDLYPTWTPDAKGLVYSSTRNAEDLNLWLDYLPAEGEERKGEKESGGGTE